jgi:hypothetical protein
MKYAIAFPKFSNRPLVGPLEEGKINPTEAIVTWVPDLRVGIYDTIRQAKTEFMHMMGEAPDISSIRGIELAVASFDAAARNLKSWKVVKIHELPIL